MRRLVVGKVVQFRILYAIPTGAKREYGQIILRDGSQLPELPVAEGFLKLRDDAAKREDNEETIALIEKLQVLESRAKADRKGLWDPDNQHIHTTYDLSNPQDVVQRWKSKPLEGNFTRLINFNA